ncbi:hypothetical protein GTO89_16400 [Heliobacterium gestii]|uniref:Uncharacterized protein n=1 Tax=Heliomicrobium gestii TaxID=2699 RepID=A0A845LHV5_HELGE|nr:hypothetical protein [Heliomicrobium gestii]MBM7868460.1 hypothetical protein [Heliomicrobium gestii]MZP44610.1 hypothetical protein [Heliomicrobium gestii]
MSPKFEPDHYISPGTAHRCFGVEPEALKQMVIDGVIPGQVEKNRVRIKEDELIRAIGEGVIGQSPRFLGMYDGKLKEVYPGVFRTVV